jgi:hypothetical protein
MVNLSSVGYRNISSDPFGRRRRSLLDSPFGNVRRSLLDMVGKSGRPTVSSSNPDVPSLSILKHKEGWKDESDFALG